MWYKKSMKLMRMLRRVTWEDTAIISDNMTGLKRYRNDDNNETGGQPPTAPLAHQMSLLNTTAEYNRLKQQKAC
ncbi:hypothetical protein TSUD_373030 [Trifolium subterraneum]|uniref:Uncharacterized protein n=1 Tax=Trifolium subterraneum TaxID=3900 RepID=A0A2Z6NEP3_TRISU|nr:hypothetical protein TSUD_373030 [Trifolium subterraneum]